MASAPEPYIVGWGTAGTARLRILFVNYEYPPLGGGGGLLNAWLAEELAGQHEVAVLTSRAFDLPPNEVVGGVDIIRSPTLFRRHMAAANLPTMATYVLSGTFNGRRLLRGRPFDIINTHFAVPTGPVGAALASYADVPNVLSVHGGDLYDPSKWTSPHRHAVLRMAVRRVARRASAIVGQSRNTIDNLRRYFLPDADAQRIPLGIPRPVAPVAGRAALGLPDDGIVLIAVGRLVARKRTDQLIRVVAELNNPRVRLVIAGDGPDASALAAQARDAGVADRVLFRGYVPEQEKIDLLAAADIYVSASEHEGFGLVYLEAMAQGLPVICYDYGGQTDFLESGINGAVLPLDDFASFVAATDDLVGNEEKRKVIAERNRKDVEPFFIENCARRYEALFYELTDAERRSAG